MFMIINIITVVIGLSNSSQEIPTQRFSQCSAEAPQVLNMIISYQYY